MTVVGPALKRARQQHILELVRHGGIHSQEELAEQLTARGFPVTQATVSRDVAELRLIKVPRGQEHVYVSPQQFGFREDPAADDRLRRLLETNPVTVGRSGLTLVLRGPIGSAQALARGIDQSSLQEQEGTVAGDDTVLVLFGDDIRLERWLTRFRSWQGLPAVPDRAE
jgi:transcriptional regulator of arginine metabolism